MLRINVGTAFKPLYNFYLFWFSGYKKSHIQIQKTVTNDLYYVLFKYYTTI